MDKQADAAKIRFFPPGIPLLTLLLGICLEWIWPIGLSFILPAPLRYYVGGGLAISALLILGLWPVLLFRRGGQSENPWKPTFHIEERGPYTFTRNPMYLQMVLICIGIAVASANWWILLLTPIAAFTLQRLAIEPEEAYLEAKFGETYLAYKRKVRRWL